MGGFSWQLSFSDDNFQTEVLDGSELVLVHFCAEWCGPCHIVSRAMEELAGVFSDRVKAGRLDVEQNTRIPEEYRVRSLPTLLFFRNGELISQLSGAISQSELAEKLSALVPA